MTQRMLSLGVTLLVALTLAVCVATPAHAGTRNDEMREAIMALRGIIDRQGAVDFFLYPTRSNVSPSHLGEEWWPLDPWTGSLMRPGDGRGDFRYTVSESRRRYRLIGYLAGGVFVVRGGMPHSIMLAYDHRSEEGANLVRQYIEDWAQANDGLYPLPADVDADGAVGTQPIHRYWPSNPWDHCNMRQAADQGSFSYELAPDRLSYALRLHRALKPDYVLMGATATDPWQQLLASLEDEILRRSGRVLAGYVDQWSLQNSGELPQTADLAADAAVGSAHGDWPRDPIGGGAMRPGSAPGTYMYTPGAAGAYELTVNLHSGAFSAGGTAPAAGPSRSSVLAEP
jgi:hypothetical protein